MATVSKRHLADLLAAGCLVCLPGGGRNTRDQIRWPGEPIEPETPASSP